MQHHAVVHIYIERLPVCIYLYTTGIYWYQRINYQPPQKSDVRCSEDSATDRLTYCTFYPGNQIQNGIVPLLKYTIETS